MFFLMLSILCSSMISIVMRAGEGRMTGKISMLAVNYITCMVIAASYVGWANLLPQGEKAGLTLGLGVINGAFYMVALVLMQINIRKNGVLLSNIFAKLGGLLIPLALAVSIFKERPGMTQMAGAILAVAAIVIINYDKQGKVCGAPLKDAAGRAFGDIAGKTSGNAAPSGLLLLLLLLTEGGASAMTKIFEELGNPALSSHFLLFTFGAAFVFCLIAILRGKERPGRAEICFGIMLGVPNFLASRFLLRALEDISAVIVYPTRSVANIVVVSLAGIFLFGERLKKRQWAAVVVILAALVLLNI